MLDQLNKAAFDYLVYRLANPPRIRLALADLSTSLEEVLETIDFLGAKSAEEAATLLETPFRDDLTYKPNATRYSDGTWRVFYSALEPETAETERGHWCSKNAQSSPPAVRRFHYRQLRCRLNATGYDIRPKQADWPFLTGDSTYPPCQAVAKEAKILGAHAMLCPSARRQDGTTTPVFERHVLSEPNILNVIVIQVDAAGGIQVFHPAS